MFKTSLRGVVAAVALASASVAAHAATQTTFLNFDTVASGTSANDYVASLGLTGLSFGNGELVDDLDTYGNPTGTLHWVDSSALYGNVQVKTLTDFWSNADLSVSKGNVLWNDNAPILVQFASPLDLLSFSVQQDLGTTGSLAGSVMSFLDSTGHVMAGHDVGYTQYGNPGYTIGSGPVAGVSGILLSAGKSYDNLQIVTAAPVPEPTTWALALAAMGLMGFMARRRQG